MNINQRITFDNTELFQFLESNMDKLQPFFYDSKYKMLLGDKFIEKLRLWDREIRRQKDIPLTLVVCGEFKRGKSSLINAILGEDVVTTDITTETITVNRISYGEHINEIVLSGGRRVVLTDDEMKSEKLRDILAELSLSGRVTSLEIKRPIEILKDITIVDTPGLGDSVRDFTDEVEYALRQADAVIYVFSAMYPLSMQEQFFIKTAILPQKYTDLILVANYCDIPETSDDCERIKKVICQRTADLLPDETPLMISALDERCRQRGTKVPNADTSEYLHGDFDKLREQLAEFLNSKRQYVIPDRIERMANAMISDLNNDIDIINESLVLSIEELKAKKEEISESKMRRSEEQENINRAIDDKIKIYIGQATEWLTLFIAALEEDANTLSEFSVEDIKKFYSVFCIESVQKALDRCTEYFAESLYDEVENVSLDIAKRLSMKQETESVSFKFGTNYHTFTAGDKLEFYNTAGSVTGVTAGLGFVPLIVSFVSGAMRESELKKNAPDIIRGIREQYPQLRASVVPAVSERYSGMAESAKKMLTEYFAEQRAALDEMLSKAEQIARQDSEKKGEIKLAIEDISSVLQSIKANLTVER